MIPNKYLGRSFFCSNSNILGNIRHASSQVVGHHMCCLYCSCFTKCESLQSFICSKSLHNINSRQRDFIPVHIPGRALLNHVTGCKTVDDKVPEGVK